MLHVCVCTHTHTHTHTHEHTQHTDAHIQHTLLIRFLSTSRSLSLVGGESGRFRFTAPPPPPPPTPATPAPPLASLSFPANSRELRVTGLRPLQLPLAVAPVALPNASALPLPLLSCTFFFTGPPFLPCAVETGGKNRYALPRGTGTEIRLVS